MMMKKIKVYALLVCLLATSAAQAQSFGSAAMRKLQMAEFAISNFYVDKVDEDKLVEEAIIKMLAQLDPHSVPIVPTLFITIACGAISGFHATQSPLMARCVRNERECRSVFFGAMISESIIALIWAAVATAFFGGAHALAEALAANGNSAAWAVNIISNTTLGIAGGILALLGVVAAPITSGDTAFRSARLIVADIFRIEQRTQWKRFAIALPLFVAGYLITRVDFTVVWRYFAWTNQTLATIVLWAVVVWLFAAKRNYFVALLPAVFMTFICASFVFVSGQFFGMENRPAAYALAGAATAVVLCFILLKLRRNGRSNP